MSFNESLIPVEESGLTTWKQGLENWASDVARMLSRRQGALKSQQCPCVFCSENSDMITHSTS